MIHTNGQRLAFGAGDNKNDTAAAESLWPLDMFPCRYQWLLSDDPASREAPIPICVPRKPCTVHSPPGRIGLSAAGSRSQITENLGLYCTASGGTSEAAV